jgi:hypothetical protein
MTQNCCAMCTFPSLQDVINIQQQPFEQMKILYKSFTFDNNSINLLAPEFGI